MLTKAVGDYSMFLTNWTAPSGGIQGYLERFLDSGDPTFQHIATWTLLQLLESNDHKLHARIKESEQMLKVIRQISEKNVEGEEEEGGEDGEAEIVLLARRCLELCQKGQGQHTPSDV